MIDIESFVDCPFCGGKLLNYYRQSYRCDSENCVINNSTGDGVKSSFYKEVNNAGVSDKRIWVSFKKENLSIFFEDCQNHFEISLWDTDLWKQKSLDFTKDFNNIIINNKNILEISNKLKEKYLRLSLLI